MQGVVVKFCYPVFSYFVFELGIKPILIVKKTIHVWIELQF